MDQEKIGKFIKELRIEKGLTQEELSELIPISREAVSKWERAKSFPEIETLKRLSEIFDVSTDELISGKREVQENVGLKLYQYNLEIKKNLKTLIILFAITIIAFLTYYFINQYKSVNIYTITGEGKNFNINYGLLIKTNEKIYFDLGTIEENAVNIEIEELELYYNINGEDIIVYITDDREIQLHDYNGYEEYFDFTNLEDILENLYIKITYNDTYEIIKLTAIKDYENKNLFISKKQEISNNEVALTNKTTSTFFFIDNINDDVLVENFYDISNIILEIKDKYNLEEENYSLKFSQNNYVNNITYSSNTNIINLEIYKNDKLINEYIYNIDGNYLIYKVYNNHDYEYEYTMVNSNCECVDDSCDLVDNYKTMCSDFFNTIYSSFEIWN